MRGKEGKSRKKEKRIEGGRAGASRGEILFYAIRGLNRLSPAILSIWLA